MRLNRLWGLALLLGVGATLLPADATFAAQDGFSGRHADCTACHNRPLPTAPPATAFLEGLPSAWVPGTTYTLTLGVLGGPPALPAPAPQGGFELETDRGHLVEAAGFEDLTRLTSPRTAAYEPAGTLVREWQVRWTAPTLAEEPAPARFWLAVVSANGDHVVALNRSDTGEKFDSAAKASATVAPHPDAVTAWLGLPLVPPRVDAVREGPDAWTVEGVLPDANATTLRHRLHGGAWRELEVASRFRLRLEGLPAGLHVLELQAAGANRTSPLVAQQVAVADAQGVVPGREAPAVPFAWSLALLVPISFLARQRPRLRSDPP